MLSFSLVASTAALCDWLFLKEEHERRHRVGNRVQSRNPKFSAVDEMVTILARTTCYLTPWETVFCSSSLCFSGGGIDTKSILT